jgi:outer membrane protein OmpA-like peptidoglycan-associated protein/opacity protein-like surface antigen
MKKLYFLILTIFLIIQTASFGQFNDYTAKFGIRGNGLLPDTEFDKDLKPTDADFKFSFSGEAFVRFELFTQALETEIGAGYGRLAGVDFNKNNWWTYIIPINLKLIVSPFRMDIWNPYAFGGVGALNFNNDKVPSVPSPNPVKQKGWTTMFPVGGGVEIALSDALLLDISGGYTFTLTDDLNGYNNRDVYAEKQSYDGYYNLGLGLIFVNGSDASDDDKDGLIKRDEKEIGTNPNDPDTDKDGLKDGEEVTTYYTNPLKADTDEDGLNDGEEVFKYKTNPNKMDTDNDQLSDGDEVLKYNTDPLKADTDGDGLTDGEEVLNTKTDPNKADTDGDGLSDGDEVKIYKTNPLNPDTDGDKLTDAEEINRYKTDPLNPDTDGGTVDDFTEVNRGTNPLDPEDDVVKINVPIVLEGITFETGKSDITPESAKILEGALKTLQTYPDIIVEISGHTDDVGSNASNQKLSQRRADSVRSWLIGQGVNGDRIIAKGYGEEYPRVPNTSPENRRMNRRIEFKRIK